MDETSPNRAEGFLYNFMRKIKHKEIKFAEETRCAIWGFFFFFNLTVLSVKNSRIKYIGEFFSGKAHTVTESSINIQRYLNVCILKLKKKNSTVNPN